MSKADGVQSARASRICGSRCESFRPKRIVGAGNLHSRHDAMEAGELGVDYLFFGRPHGDTHDAPHPKALDLAEWWSELMQMPAVIMAGRSARQRRRGGRDRRGLRRAARRRLVASGGPAEAVALAQAALAAGTARRMRAATFLADRPAWRSTAPALAQEADDAGVGAGITIEERIDRG